MGGGFNFFQQLQAPQYQDQTFSNDQIMSAAKGADQGLRDAYKAELVNQLRAGNFKDSYGVYQNVLNGRERQAQMDAYNQQVAQQQAAEQAAQDQPNYYMGTG